MNETPKLETPSCANPTISVTTNKFQKYDQSEKGRARYARRDAKRKAKREARRITRQIKWAHRTLGVVCHSANSEAKTVPLPAVAENTRTTGWERIREIGEGVLILPDRKLPYRAGLTFDSWEVQRVEAQLGDLRFSALYMGGAR